MYGKAHTGPIPIPIVGIIMIGSPTVTANGFGKARLGDLVMCSCGHPAQILVGSPTVTANGMPLARVGDMFSGCPVGTIITGSPNILVV